MADGDSNVAEVCTTPNMSDGGEAGGSEPVMVVEDTEQEARPEDAVQALALNADGLRFWLNEVTLSITRAPRQC